MLEKLFVSIIQVIILFLPAGIANIAPVLVKKINFFNKPISEKLFGLHKTYRGFIFGIIAAIIIIYLEYLLSPFIDSKYLLVNYSSINLAWLGFLLGFGALFGDLAKSFFKRRMDISPGKTWPFFDQLDYIVGAVLFVSFYLYIPGEINLLAIILFGLLHPITNYLGFLVGLKKNKF